MDGAPSLFPLSYRKIRSFLACRRQYWFRYCSGLAPEPAAASEAAIVGIAVHRGLAVLTDTGRDDLGRQEVDAYLRMPSHELAGPGTKAYERAMGLYEAGVAAHRALEGIDPRAEVESWAPWPERGITLWAKVDRFERTPDGGYRLIDWKTGATLWAEETDRQLDLAHVIVRTVFRIPRDATVESIAWNLQTGERRVRPLGRDDAKAAMEYAAELAARMQACEAFPPTPGPACGWCEFRGRCDAALTTVDTWLEDPDA
ncbi:MAG: PD-(D/E)XK nuclease family protein [Chloroflexota bacterium]|nr:PD-(D/E)XK nuclease family protein [Dehalococcoidia bacterium]MDW8047694.1 PD-(D/E)XK nuclease family protein [Chloroflexota bacterium]